MATDEIERREYFRITDRLLVEFREIGYEESLELGKSLRQSDFVPDNQRNDSSLPFKAPVFVRNELYAFLEALDRKLNTILELLQRKDDQFFNEFTDVNISGAGLRYRSQKHLPEGAYLELRVVLPFFPNPRIAALGRVVRSRPYRTERGKDSWETAIKFVAINEKHRDLLISYVFAKEREQLRAKQALSG